MKSKLKIDYKWTILLNNFLDNSWKSIPIEYRKPGIYRWTIKTKSDQISYYIGESVDIKNRIRSYMRPGPTQRTSQRINKLFREFSKKGALVKLELMEIIAFEINNKQCSIKYLENSSVRKLIENLILTEHKRAKKTVHNL